MTIGEDRVPTVREVDGKLVIDWPDPRPDSFRITAEAFEVLVDRANGISESDVMNEEHPDADHPEWPGHQI